MAFPASWISRPLSVQSGYRRVVKEVSGLETLEGDFCGFLEDKDSELQVYSKLITQALCEDLTTCDVTRFVPTDSYQASWSSPVPYDPIYQQLSPSETGQLTDGPAICEDVAVDGSMQGCR
jgi:hypothetical protein